MAHVVRVALLLLALTAPSVADALSAARAQYDAGDFEAAARSYRAIVGADPRDDAAHTGLIRSLLRLDEVEASQTAATEAESFPIERLDPRRRGRRSRAQG